MENKPCSFVPGFNGSPTATATGSSTTKTGQDSTILFVLGGMLVAAAGVMFVTRRKKN